MLLVYDMSQCEMSHMTPTGVYQLKVRLLDFTFSKTVMKATLVTWTTSSSRLE